MRLEAFAKINWSLDITGVREDGYHLMDMLMQPISLADEISVKPAESLRLTTGGYPPVRPDNHNLILRAARALQEITGCTLGAEMHLQKRIPVGAGLGGGSADAAATLAGLNRLWGTGLSSAELEKLGLTLGADIPFCLRGGLTRTRGIGEDLESHPCRSSFWLIVIQPCRGLSTGSVFSAWHAAGSQAHPKTEEALAALEKGDLDALCSSVSNVLQPISEAMRPAIGESVRALKTSGALTALMTGSGSAVFGVFRNPRIAKQAHEALSHRWRSCFLCHTQQDSFRMTED